MIIGFSGHRTQKLKVDMIPGIKSQIKALLIQLKPEKCISGMATGVDTFAAEICVELKIPFIAAVPFIGQEVLWSKEDKAKYSELLDLAEEVVIVSPGVYASWKLQKRNEYIVDNCDEAIVCYDGKSGGGTKNFINYANKKRRSIRYITC